MNAFHCRHLQAKYTEFDKAIEKALAKRTGRRVPKTLTRKRPQKGEGEEKIVTVDFCEGAGKMKLRSVQNSANDTKTHSHERSAKASHESDSGLFSREGMVSCPSTARVSSSGEDSLRFSPIQGRSLCACEEECFAHTLTPASDGNVELDLSKMANTC